LLTVQFSKLYLFDAFDYFDRTDIGRNKLRQNALALSALLVALLATPQFSLGRSIPRGLQKARHSVEPNGPDAGMSPSRPFTSRYQQIQ